MIQKTIVRCKEDVRANRGTRRIVACSAVLGLAISLVSSVQSCATSRDAEIGALTALSIAAVVLEQAREEAYREGLAKASIADYQSLAAAEKVRASAMKELIRIIRISRSAHDAGDGGKAQMAVLLRGVVDTADDLLLAFSSPPLPAVRVPSSVLSAISGVREVIDAIEPKGGAIPPKPPSASGDRRTLDGAAL